jgi:uncharacterized protein YkwD
MKQGAGNANALLAAEELEKITDLDGKYSISKYIIIQLSLIILLEACLAAMLFFVAPTSYTQATTETSNSNKINSLEILKKINHTRLSYQLSPLVLDSQLQQAAQKKADDLLAGQYFSHTSPSGKKFSSWIKESGYDYLRVGENLAIYFTDNNKLVDAWLNSPRHRQNILNPYYKDTGIAARQGEFRGQQTWLVVQIFGEETTETPTKTKNPLILTLDQP